jgi:hypothetical protein
MKINSTCAYCLKKFQHYPSYGRGRFCSPDCYNKYRHQKKYTECVCEECGKIFKKRTAAFKVTKKHYCSPECANKRFLNPKNNPRWNNGKRTYNGYYSLLRKEHPFADHAGYVYEHRLVMENYLGRYLKPEEQVHHINGDKTDNQIENLMVFKNAAEHTKYHAELENN